MPESGGCGVDVDVDVDVNVVMQEIPTACTSIHRSSILHFIVHQFITSSFIIHHFINSSLLIHSALQSMGNRWIDSLRISSLEPSTSH